MFFRVYPDAPRLEPFMIKSYNQGDYEQDTESPSAPIKEHKTAQITQSPAQEDSEDSDKETEETSDSDISKRRRIVLQRGYKLEGSSRKSTE